MDAPVTRLPSSPCPQCGYTMDACGPAVDGRPDGPGPGDNTICFRCATVLRFRDDMTMRRLTDEEIAALEPEEQRDINHARSFLRRWVL